MSYCNDGSAVMTMPVVPAGQGAGYGASGLGWGGDWISWILIFLIICMFGGNWGGFGGMGGFGGAIGPAAQGYDTRADLQRGFDNQTVVNKLNGLENGLCSLGYDQLGQINGVNANMAAGFAGVNNAVCQLGYQGAELAGGVRDAVSQAANAHTIALMQGQNALQAQLADCCCTNRYEALQNANATQALIQANTTQGVMNTGAIQAAVKDCCCESEKIAMQSRFDAQQYNCATLQAIDKLGDRLDARLTAQDLAAKDARIAELDRQNAELRLRASQAAQTADIRASIVSDLRNCPVGTYNVPNPNCCYGPWGGNNWTGFVPQQGGPCCNGYAA